MSDVTINVTVRQGGSISADLSNATIVNARILPAGQIAASVTGGGKGEKGDTGDTGPTGPQGPIGPHGGVPNGGTTDQVLKKNSDTNQDTEWHTPVKADVGLPNADNTSDVDKPISTLQQAAIDDVQDDLDDHEADTANPHNVTKSQIGLSNADNTSDANKPVSTAQATAIGVVQSDIDAHEANTSNPHSVTKTQVGLANADNTSDANKPISSAQQTALDAKVAGPASVTDDLPAVFDGTGGKTIKQKTYAAFKTLLALVKGDVGLANVDNTSDANKPVSTATQTALDLKEDIADLGDLAYEDEVTEAEINLSDNTTNNFSTSEHGFVPKGPNTGKFLKDDGTWDSIPGGGDMLASTYDPQTIGADAFDQDNMTDGVTNKNFTATEEAKLGHISVSQAVNLDTIESDLSSHIANTSNPHSVTKSQVGLGNVDNTSNATERAASATLTNKTIDGDDNTLTDIGDASLKFGGLLRDIRVYTANDTWSKPAGLRFAVIEVIGGGGGGAGNASASTNNGAGGGGGGGFARKKVVVGTLGATEAVTVGAAGAAGATNNNGGTGGTTSFGTHAVAAGGVGGITGAGGPGGAGGIGTTGDLKTAGGGGGAGAANTALSGAGGTSYFGGGAQGRGDGGVADAAQAYGGGGAGGCRVASGGRSGAAGSAGVVIVYEYFQAYYIIAEQFRLKRFMVL